MWQCNINEYWDRISISSNLEVTFKNKAFVYDTDRRIIATIIANLPIKTCSQTCNDVLKAFLVDPENLKGTHTRMLTLSTKSAAPFFL